MGDEARPIARYWLNSPCSIATNDLAIVRRSRPAKDDENVSATRACNTVGHLRSRCLQAIAPPGPIGRRTTRVSCPFLDGASRCLARAFGPGAEGIFHALYDWVKDGSLRDWIQHGKARDEAIVAAEYDFLVENLVGVFTRQYEPRAVQPAIAHGEPAIGMPSNVLEIGARCMTVSILQGPNQQTCRPTLGCEALSVTSFRTAIDLKDLCRIPQTETEPFVAVVDPCSVLLSKQGGRKEKSYYQAQRDLHDTSSQIGAQVKLCNRLNVPCSSSVTQSDLGRAVHRL